MKLIKTSFFTGIATVIQVATLFIINKVVAVYVGPAGLAIIGQFQNFSQIAQTIANGAINQGVVKYVAEYHDNLLEKCKILSTALVICVCCSIALGICLFLFRNFLSLRLLESAQFSSIFVVFSITVIFFSLNSFLLSILNGEKDIRNFTIVNISNSLFNLILVSFLSIYYHLFGALLALVLNQSMVFFVTLILILKSSWFKLGNFLKGIDKGCVARLCKYSVMAIATALTAPVAQIIIRNYIGRYLSWDDAGYWQAITKISDVYLLVITSTLAVYYLPRLSEIQDKVGLKKEILYGYKVILPVAAIMASGIFLCKSEIIAILFDDKFSPMLTLFKFQLIGDVVKIGSWLLGYLLIAKAKTKIFIVTEILFSISYVLLAMLGINIFGLVGVTIAFAVNYIFYWIMISIVTKKIFLTTV